SAIDGAQNPLPVPLALPLERGDALGELRVELFATLRMVPARTGRSRAPVWRDLRGSRLRARGRFARFWTGFLTVNIAAGFERPSFQLGPRSVLRACRSCASAFEGRRARSSL